MAETPRSTHSEAIAGVRVKRFLTLAVMKLANELLTRSDTEETRKFIESTILDLVKTNFSLTSSDNPLSQAKLFIASLGFSPCEIEWAEDVRLGKILLGKGRLWKATTKRDTELVKLLLSTIVKGIGTTILNSSTQVNFIEDAVLPPRFTYELQFRASEDVFAETIQKVSEDKEKSEFLLSAGSLLSPILGTGIRIQAATRNLIEATRTIAEEVQPDLLQRKDLEEYPLKLLEVVFIKFQENDQLTSIAHRIGVLMVEGIRQEFPDIENHKLLKGIGLLPPEEIDELLFYGSVEICGTKKRGVNLGFCHFLGDIWAGYSSGVLGREFQMSEDPLCASGTGTKCIFTLEAV